MPKLKPLSEQVIVITGASSGIGLATAKMAAARGAKVVLAARTRDALAQAVDEINQTGPGHASFVEADVSRIDDHEKIAAHARERHGRIDTWVNNAGVLIFGYLEETAEADMRRLFDVNFWGTVHGSMVAIRHLRQGGGGALINVGSVESDRSLPLQGIYASSKHALKAFTETLRMELEEEGAPISVTLVKPATIGSPLPQHAMSVPGVEPHFPPPVYAPEEVAASILAAAERPMRETFVGGSARMISTLSALAPRTMDWISEKFLVSGQMSDRPAAADNLYAGHGEGRVRGDHEHMIRPSLYSKAARHPLATLAVAGGIAAGAFLLTRWRSEAEFGRDMEVEEPPLEGV
ncbi:MAG: SDR family oxidoreductase [Allosphingosinicella sp.]|uniref:SDR family oxidoreductase n=1 Tax=Allosphingosinicella sp. TaxID=2823234 RepID=UPI00392F6FA2